MDVRVLDDQVFVLAAARRLGLLRWQVDELENALDGPHLEPGRKGIKEGGRVAAVTQPLSAPTRQSLFGIPNDAWPIC